MTMERQDYPAILPQVQPAQAVDILNDRVRQVGRLNTAIADWLQERRKIEEQYSTGLRRLARKNIDDVDLGIFSVSWGTLTGAVNTMADSHSALAAKIEVDVEQPLREFATSNREMQAMTTMQGNLASMAKDVERAKQKTEKLQGRGERAEAGKVANASSDLDTAESQWESQAPYVFENLQAVDEARLNRLRDVLTQYQTHEVDLVQKSQTTAEHCLNVLLRLQTEDEIKTFALKAVQGRPRVERTQRPSAPSVPTLSRGATGSSSGLTPTMSQPDDDSMRSGSMQEDTKKKSRFGALKRLGTVAGGRKRESKQPATLAPMSESPERKSRSPFNSLGGRFGKSKGMTELEPPAETPTRERPRSPLRMGSEMFEPSNVTEQPASPIPTQRSETAPQVNGTSSAFGSAPYLASPIPNGSHQGDLTDLEPPKPSQPVPQAASETQRDAEGYSLPPRELDPISQAQADAAAAGEGSAPAFNVNIRNAPIQDDSGDHQAALANMASALQPPPFVASKVGTVRGRRNRPVSMVPGPQEQQSSQTPPAGVISPAAAPTIMQPSKQTRDVFSEPSPAPGEQTPITTSTAQSPSNAFESGPASGGGFSPFASTMSQQPYTEQPRTASPVAQSPSGTFGTGTPGAGSFSPFASTMSQQVPLRTDSRSAVGDHLGGGDTGSIRSGRSLTSTGSQALKHPDLTETGLNSSVVETVSARFENGKLTSSSLIGEIALAYNPTGTPSTSGSENIRLEQFASLENVAPNPAFITQTPGKEGEYSVNLATLSKTQVAFKYQVRADDAGSQAPLLIAPAFKIEPTQASIIVSYSLNSAFNLHGRESVTLSNAMLALTLEGAKATGCQSRPVGTFSRERNLIFWQLGDVTLKAGAAPEKLLARFATESEASSGGSVEARWEIGGENVLGLGSGLSVSLQGQTTGGGDGGADPFADEDAAGGLTAVWKGVQGVKRLTSGAYSAK